MSRCSCSEDLPSQIQVVETHCGSILQDLLELEPSRVVWILDVLQALSDRSTAFVKSIRPGVEQSTVSGVVTGRAPGGKLLVALPWFVRIVTIGAGEPAVMRVGRPGEHP